MFVHLGWSSLPEENCEVRFTGTITGKDELEIETKKILDETYRKNQYLKLLKQCV